MGLLFFVLDLLEDDGNALATANAGRADGVLALALAELVGEVARDASTRGTEGVAEGDGTSVDVELGDVNAELLGDGEDLGRKGLVNLDDVHLAQVEIGLAESALQIPKTTLSLVYFPR